MRISDWSSDVCSSDLFELIEPLGYNDSVWSDSLPKNGTFALQFHHVAATVHGTMEEFERYRATWDIEKHPIVVDGWAGDDARWFYTDERKFGRAAGRVRVCPYE